MESVDRNSAQILSGMIDEISRDAVPWGMALVRRDFLRTLTNEAFQVAISPALNKSEAPAVFFIDPKTIFVIWKKNQKEVYQLLRNVVCGTLTQPNLGVSPSTIVAYYDPMVRGDDVKTMLNKGLPSSNNDDDDFFLQKETDNANGGDLRLAATEEQKALFQKRLIKRPYRKQMNMLVVEDMEFQKRLLCEVLRSARSTTYHDGHEVETASGVRDGWKKFLSAAHDIVFIDLGLVDGSGHVLARAVKELDPGTHVVIVTANTYEEEMSVASQNNIDCFISKPYNKKQILGCVEKCISNGKAANKLNPRNRIL